MAEPSPETVEEIDVVEAIVPPAKLMIRYCQDNYNHDRWHHIAFDISAVTPGDIGGLYAALCNTITTDLIRVQQERRATSKKSTSFGLGSAGREPRYERLDCELRIDHCRLLDNGRLVLPPLGKCDLQADVDSEGQRPSRKMDLIEFLLRDGVKTDDAWGEQIVEGLLFQEGTAWPWYCLKAEYKHESRLNNILRYHARLVAAGVDPQTFFPIPPPPPTPPPPPPPVPEKEVKSKEGKAREVKAREARAPAAASGSKSRKVDLMRSRSKSAFTMKSLIKS